MLRFASITLGCLLSLTALRASSPDPASLIVDPAELAEARKLIRKLGDREYREREKAFLALYAMGRQALTPLEEALENPEPEIAERVKLLYPRALAADLEARIKTFLLDTEYAYEHDLPAWTIFRNYFGNEPSLRKLYTDIVRERENLEILRVLHTLSNERRLLLAAVGGGLSAAGAEIPNRAELERALGNRKMAIQARLSPPAGIPPGQRVALPTIAEIVPILLVEIINPTEILQFNPMMFNTMNFFHSAIARETLNGKTEYSDIFRSVMEVWMRSRVGSVALGQAMNLANQYRFDRELTVEIASKLLLTPNVPHHAAANAIMALGKADAVEALPLIRKKLKDEGLLIQLGTVNAIETVQLRDFALATMIYLTNQSPQDYGFTTNGNVNKTTRFNYSANRFALAGQTTTQEALRNEALERWATWETTTYGCVASPLGPRALLHNQDGLIPLQPAKPEK